MMMMKTTTTTIIIIIIIKVKTPTIKLSFVSKTHGCSEVKVETFFNGDVSAESNCIKPVNVDDTLLRMTLLNSRCYLWGK
jgi:hypothetical protein